ncbi:hypothetical protein QTG56_24090 (plasmid) [Rossellomorea sp. AcN35-11]|nr:hypothetical protein [Rossellomorea aquimaris]WJV31720.1 hypothetical protein QTG56_24090 [Rossellomorea sp. AcN35-11]
MDLTIFTEGAGGSGKRWFVGKSDIFLDTKTFLDDCWREFYLEDEYQKPNHEAVYKNWVKAFDDYGSEGSPMEIESGYCFCNVGEKGSFTVYVLNESDLRKK